MGQSRTENFKTINVTILSGQSLSDSEWVEGMIVFGFKMPDAWTAADLTAQASDDGITWMDIYDTADAEWSAKVAASRFCLCRTDKPWLGGMKHMRLRSGTAAAPISQDADRIIALRLAFPNA